jgi:hypothetical protein
MKLFLIEKSIEFYITHILVNDIEENNHICLLLLMHIDQVDE